MWTCSNNLKTKKARKPWFWCATRQVDKLNNVEDGPHEIRWISDLRRPERSGDMNLGFVSPSAKKRPQPKVEVFWCGRWDLNPHDCNSHKILSLARLPVPTLPHMSQLFVSDKKEWYQKSGGMSTVFWKKYKKHTFQKTEKKCWHLNAVDVLYTLSAARRRSNLICRNGGIGRRARFRSVWLLQSWGFKSLFLHFISTMQQTI